jgi:hypothetical protein
MIAVLFVIQPLPGFQQLEEHTVRNAIPTPPIFQNPFMAPNNFSEIHLNGDIIGNEWRGVFSTDS